MFRLKISVVLACYLITHIATAEEPRIKYPSDYKQAFTNYLSLDRTQNPDQIIRLFANDIALKGEGPGANEKIELVLGHGAARNHHERDHQPQKEIRCDPSLPVRRQWIAHSGGLRCSVVIG